MKKQQKENITTESCKWTCNSIPDLSGRIAIVTGGNAGLGFQSALELSRRGATVVIACRDTERGQAAVSSIKAMVPDAAPDTICLDLLNHESIRLFAETFMEKYSRLDILLNNAGVVNLKTLKRDSLGNEMHMATNHFGHFALTGRLFPLLKSTDSARVVTVSSISYKAGVIDFGDLAWERRKYSRAKSYGDSKLANLLFMAKLQERFQQTGVTALSVSAHPGLTGTERQQTIGMGGIFARVIASPIEKGCLPQLRAATDPSVKANDFYGPRFGLWGNPVLQKIKPGILDTTLAEQLWQVSEEKTGVSF